MTNNKEIKEYSVFEENRKKFEQQHDVTTMEEIRRGITLRQNPYMSELYCIICGFPCNDGYGRLGFFIDENKIKTNSAGWEERVAWHLPEEMIATTYHLVCDECAEKYATEMVKIQNSVLNYVEENELRLIEDIERDLKTTFTETKIQRVIDEIIKKIKIEYYLGVVKIQYDLSNLR